MGVSFTRGMYSVSLAFKCSGQDRLSKLFELTNSYDAVYKWCDHLKANGHYITGYVILPNHLHVLVGFKALTQSINTIVSNGKRFIAYEIVKRLEEQKKN